jgi:hypothetical protein
MTEKKIEANRVVVKPVELSVVGVTLNIDPQHVDNLKDKKFIAIYLDHDNKYRFSQNRVTSEEICYMLNLALNRLFED